MDERLPASFLISVLCTRMVFSDVGKSFNLDDDFVAAASSNIEIGGKESASTMTLFILEHEQVHFCQGLQGCFWVRKLQEKTVPPWRGLRSTQTYSIRRSETEGLRTR